MRFGNYYLNQQKTVSYFALFPVTIEGETRWLEKVTILKEWYKGGDFGEWCWTNIKFIDKE